MYILLQAPPGRGLPDGHSSPASHARQTMDRLHHKITKYNGCTLPGGGAPKPPSTSRGHKPDHAQREEFLIHYEPYTLESSQSMHGINQQSNGNVQFDKFEVDYVENRRRSWDASMIHHQKELNNNVSRTSSLRSDQGQRPGPRVDARTRDVHIHTLSRPPQLSNGATSVTSFSSASSAFTPTGPLSQSSSDVTNLPQSMTSSGTSSSASTHSLTADATDLRNYSLPNIGDMEIAEIKHRNKVVHSNSFTCLRDRKRARNLPSLKISQQHVEEKRRSIADQFSDKLRKYLKERRASLNVSLNTSHSSSVTCEPPVREYDPVADRDDTMSVTSMEVADILAGAPPPAPSDDEDENYDGDVQSDSTIERDSPLGDGGFVPMKFADGPSSREVVPLKKSPPPIKIQQGKEKPGHLASFVEQSMKSFISKVNKPGNNKEACSAVPPPPPPTQDTISSSNKRNTAKQPVPLFTILRTHQVNCVSVLKQRRKDPLHITVADSEMDLPNGLSEYKGQSNSPGILVLCVVTYANPGPTVFVVGELRQGDIILEVGNKQRYNVYK